MRSRKDAEDLLPHWPALMPLAMAARYLSIDEASFLSLARRTGVFAVEPAAGAVRWRRKDLEQLVSDLPPVAVASSGGASPAPAQRSDGISDADVTRIVERLRTAGPTQPQAYSVKDAAAVAGISRSKLYNLMKEGRLKAVHVGTRTLIPRIEIETLLALPARKTD